MEAYNKAIADSRAQVLGRIESCTTHQLMPDTPAAAALH